MQVADIAAERAVLGSIILSNDLIHPVSAVIEPSDFSTNDYRRAFAAMQELGKGIDPFSLHAKLTGTNLGLSEISQWTDGVVLYADNAVTHAKRVKEYALRRRGMAVAERTGYQLGDSTVPVEEALRTAQDAILDMIAGTVDHPTYSAYQIANETLVQIAERRKRGDQITGMRFGLACLDEFTGGINSGEFAIIAARPSIGKTSLAVQATRANAEAWHPVFVFSAEMTRTQFFSRLLSQVSGIPNFLIRRPFKLNNADEKKLQDVATQIAEWPWYLADRSNPHVSEVVSRAVTEVKRHKCELIIVDHLQKIRGDGKSATEEMTNISAALTQLAKDYAPVIALSQLARPEDHNKAKWPTMLELRGSGMLEADAHVIIMLHRELDEQKQYTENGYAIVEKQREGMTGALKVRFDTDLLKFMGA